MAIDGEPRNGDYARYIDELIHRGQPSPGQVSPQTGTARPASPTPSPGEVTAPEPRGIAMPDIRKMLTARSRTNAAKPSTADAPAADTTLAAKAAQRRGALATAIVALAIVWQAIRMLVAALERPQVDWNDMVPVAFLLVFAGMLWRASRSQRKRAKQAPTRLPPLTTATPPPASGTLTGREPFGGSQA
ncbi:hypothetical protein [Bordetella flabilis]|nr:hypothetical protein [Bordetella flabilis]